MDEHRTAMVYKIKVGIDNPEGLLKPGLPADVTLKWN
jgi:HlyD family secretion protein